MTDHKPKWWLLYTIAIVGIAVPFGAQMLGTSGTWLEIAQLATVFLIFVLMLVWIRCNYVALLHNGQPNAPRFSPVEHSQDALWTDEPEQPWIVMPPLADAHGEVGSGADGNQEGA